MNWLKCIFRRKQLYGDLAVEIREHLEEKVEEYVAGGMPRDEAEHRARRDFGNLLRTEEVGREAWQWPRLENFLTDLRFGFRVLAKNPGFAMIVIIVLALGLCSSIAVFAFVDAALVQPLPYADPPTLAGVYEVVEMFPLSNLSYQDYLDWKKQNSVFQSFDVWTGAGYLMRTVNRTEPVPAMRVTDGFFRTLGVKPLLGRDFFPGEDRPGAAPTVVLSYEAWQKWFAGRPDIVGQPATLTGEIYTIIGVLPKGFHFAPRGRADFWTTLRKLNGCEQRRSCHNLWGIARLKPGATIQMAAGEMKTIAKQLEAQYPDSNRGQGATVVPLSEAIVGKVRPIFLAVLAGAGLLLLIACVNVASLLLVRAEARRREFAVRTALGASGSRLMVQFATEGLLLVGASCAVGLIGALWLMRLLSGMIPEDLAGNVPFLAHLGLNSRIGLFAALLVVVICVMFSLTPAIRLSPGDVQQSLAEGSRGSAGTVWRRVGSKLVVAELVIAVVLLVSGGLLAKSLYRLLHVPMGFMPDHLATLEVFASETKYDKPAQQIALARLVTEQVGALPGVQVVGLTSRLPLTGNGNTTWIRIVGRPYSGEHNEVNERDVSPAYFSALRARLIQGRFFREDEDDSKAPVAIINQNFARQYFPGVEPLGHKIGDTDLSPKSLREVVGVVDDVREGSLEEQSWPTLYEPFNQSPDNGFSLVVRSSQSEEAILPVVDATIREVDPDIGILSEYTMARRINESPSAYLHRWSAWLVGGFAAIAMILGVVGLYGVVAYSVTQRTREIGVRMALGAQRRSVYQLVLREAGTLAAIGIVAGLACAIGAAVLMRGLLFGVASWDITTLVLVAATLAIFALLASFVPARRATRVDPVLALRHQ
jgi:macrolide transport system ATP-binding/permease protein